MRYSANVDNLLSYGAIDFQKRWSKEVQEGYLRLGFTPDDIPALLQLALDEKLFWEEEEPLYSAPYHAWRVLGLLKAEQAISPLLNEFQQVDPEDWFSEEIPNVLALIGEKAILPMLAYLVDENIDEDAKLGITGVFSQIAQNEPEFKAQCQEILVSCLKQITTQESTLAGFLVSALLDLDAREEIEIIREAFQHGYIDIDVVGDIEQVEIELGLRQQRSTPRPISPKIQAIREVLKQNFGAEYDDDENPKPTKSVKIGRNDLCPCGSGKKYKKCCLH